LLFTLGWSHYLILCRIEDEAERKFYEIEATNNSWSLEELQRQLNASLYERLALSKNKKKVLTLSKKGQIIREPKDIIKNPLILEFLGLEEKPYYSETDLETAIINQIERFMLELGKGFFFGGRQVRITIAHKHFSVDLVFYNRLLKCFVVVDLKIGELEHSDLGQMQMYVNHYDRNVKDKVENPTIGIIICKSKNDAVVEITLPENQKQIFASQYKLYLPTKQELKKLIERNQ
jgi:predicted nuclease of restriction endonuclease-like (RecB) superfamily